MASNTDYTKFKNAPLYAQNSGVVAACKTTNWWWAGEIDDEPVLPLTQGVEQCFTLWRKPQAITKVVQYATGKTFVEGIDYSLHADGKLIIPAGSAIVSAPAGFLTTPDPSSPYLSQSLTKENTPLYLGSNYTNYQIAVSYTTASVTPPEANPLPRLSQALGLKTPYAITFYGDSITLGGQCSSNDNQAPQLPDYADMFGAYLSSVAAGTIYWRNLSVFGIATNTALADVGNILDTASDMVVLAFGMNDSSSAGRLTKQQFKANLIGMIETIRQTNGNVEIVLVSGVTSNPDWIENNPLFHGYRDVMHEIVGQYVGTTAICVVDVTAVWEDVLKSKSYYDVTASGVNHPGDFGHKLYVQTMIQALCGSEPT